MVKACNQIVVGLVIEAVAEAMVLGTKAGVAPGRVSKVLSGGLASNKILEVKGEKFLSHEFTPGGNVEYHRKDLGIALAAGREYGVTLPARHSWSRCSGHWRPRKGAAGTTRR